MRLNYQLFFMLLMSHILYAQKKINVGITLGTGKTFYHKVDRNPNVTMGGVIGVAPKRFGFYANKPFSSRWQAELAIRYCFIGHDYGTPGQRGNFSDRFRFINTGLYIGYRPIGKLWTLIGGDINFPLSGQSTRIFSVKPFALLNIKLQYPILRRLSIEGGFEKSLTAYAVVTGSSNIPNDPFGPMHTSFYQNYFFVNLHFLLSR